MFYNYMYLTQQKKQYVHVQGDILCTFGGST